MPPRGGLGRQRPTKFCNQMGGEILSRKERNQKAHTENGNGKKDRKTSVDTKERDELRCSGRAGLTGRVYQGIQTCGHRK